MNQGSNKQTVQSIRTAPVGIEASSQCGRVPQRQLPGYKQPQRLMGIYFFFFFWPGDSLVPPEVDFDRLLASLQDLSELVSEGEAQVTPMPGGAQLRTLEPIPLKLYRNGIMMFDGPFRPFYDPSTQVGWGCGAQGDVEPAHCISVSSTEYTGPTSPVSEFSVVQEYDA